MTSLPKYATLEISALDTQQRIFRVQLNRPNRHNALNKQIMSDLIDFFEGLATHKYLTETDIIIFKGAGKSFCAGIDITSSLENPVPPTPPSATFLSALKNTNLQESDHIFQIQRPAYETEGANRVALAMRKAPQIIIGALHGSVIGAGFSLALACDLRVGSQCVKLSQGRVTLGLNGAELGSSYLLPRLVGYNAAMELMLTAKFIDAEKALQLGLCSAIYANVNDLEAACESLAKTMVKTSSRALRLTKLALRHSVEHNTSSFEKAVEFEQACTDACLADEKSVAVAHAYAKSFQPKPKAKL